MKVFDSFFHRVSPCCVSIAMYCFTLGGCEAVNPISRFPSSLITPQAKVALFGPEHRLLYDEVFSNKSTGALDPPNVIVPTDSLTYKSVSLLGDFPIQAELPIDEEGINLIEAIAQVGGVTSADNQVGVVLVLNENGEERTLSYFNTENLEVFALMRQVVVFDGDTIVGIVCADCK
jgi:hypothetical protein